MTPTVFFITGFPGSGKLTVAQAIADQLAAEGEDVRVVDNHWINNPIFGLVDADGVTPLPAAVWDRVAEVGSAVFRTLEELTPRHWHVVLTAYVDASDAEYPARVELLAERRDSVFAPVRLLCEVEENVRRITLPGRAEHMKSIDPDEPRRLAAQGLPSDLGLDAVFTLDVTDTSPEAAASEVVAHARDIG